ncbi:MAG: hypothetical protein LEGION0398_MBIBDBAK_00551 [Legionellaceae bacterium]
MLAKMQHDFLLPKGILAYLDKNIAEYEGIVSQYKNRYGEELIIKELNIYINIKYTGSENVTLSETKNFLYISAQLSLNEDSIIIWERIFERVISFIRDKIKKIQNEEKNEWKIIMYDYFDALFRKFFPNDVMAALPYALLLYQDEVEKDNYHAKEKINYCLKTLLLKTRSKLFDTKESTKELKQEWDAFKQEQGVEELNENLTILFKELLEKRQKTIIMGLETEERNTYITVFQNYWYKKLSEIKNAYFDEEWERFIADLNNHHDFIDKEFSYFSVHLSGLLKTREDSGLRIENWFQKFNAIPNCKPHIVDINLPDWESWIQKIRNTKNKFQDCALDSFEEIQQNYQSSVEDVLRSIFKYSLELLPENNMEFSILALGSLARKALNADSDIEFAVLLKQDDEKSVAIIQELFSVWSLCIYLLADDWILAKGETSHWRKIGLQLEAVKFEKYCKTPENYAKESEIAAKDIINNNGESFMYFHGLCLANEIYTTSPFQNEPILVSAVEYDKALFPLKQNTSSILFRDYQQRLSQSVLTIDKESLFFAYFNSHANDFLNNFRGIQFNKNKRILSFANFQSWEESIKTSNEKMNEKQLKEIAIKPLMRFFEHVMQFETQLVTDVTYTTFTSIQIPLSIQNTLKKHLHYLNYLRCAFVYPENRIDTTEFSEAFQKVFDMARFYIFPLYTSLTKTINKNLPLSETLRNPYAAFIHMFNTDESLELTEALIESLVYILNKEEEWTNSFDTIAFHERLFKRMPTFALKKFYYESIKRIMDEDRKNSVLSHVGNIPLVTGERLSWLCDYPLWVKGLKTEMGASETEKPSYATLILIGINEPFFLKEDIANQFWDGKKQALKPSELPGNHLVYKLSLKEGHDNRFIYLKCYPGLPGLNDSLQYLYRRLFGATDGLPWSVTGLLTIGVKKIPVILSDDVGDKLDSDDPRLTHSLLNHVSLSKLLLFSILTNPEDGKCDNYAVIKNRDGTYTIRSIDNDQSFAEGQEKTQKTTKNTFYDIKTVLFCLEEMKEPLNREVIEEFITLDTRNTLKAWLFDLVNLQHEYHHLFQAVSPFSEKEIKAHRGSYLDMVLPLSIVTRMSYKFEQIQQLLREDPTLTPLALLQEVEPSIANGYQLVLEQPLSPSERFDKLVKENQWYAYNPKTKSYDTTKTYASQLYQTFVKENAPETVTPQTALTILNQQFEKIDTETLKNLSVFLRNISHLSKASRSERELTLKYAQLNQLPVTNRHALITLISQFTDFEKLYFNFPQHTLTQALLEKILNNNQGLKKLSLVNALGLNSLSMLEGKPIEILVIKQLPNIKSITLGLPKVKVLIIENCPQLKSIAIQAPKLERLRLLDCLLLNNLSLPNSLDLQDACLSGVRELPLVQFYQRFPGLISRLDALPPMLTFRIATCVTKSVENHTFVSKESIQAIHEIVMEYTRVLQSSIDNLTKAFDPTQKYQQEMKALFLGYLGFDTPYVIQKLVEMSKGTGVSFLRTNFAIALQRYAIKALGKLQTKDTFAIKTLVRALKEDYSYVVRVEAAETLGELQAKEPFVIKALLNCFFYSDYQYIFLAEQVLQLLSQLKVKELFVIEILVKALQHDFDIVRLGAAKTLGELQVKEPFVIKALVKSLLDKNMSIRCAAAKSLNILEFKELFVIESLVKALDDNDAFVRTEAAETLGELQVKEPFVIEALVKSLLDEDWSVRNSTVKALGELHVKEPFVIEALVKALDDHAFFRFEVAHALVKLQVKELFVIKALVEYLLRDDILIRRAAAKSLNKLEFKKFLVIEFLVKILQDNHVFHAAEALGELQAKEPFVIEALVKALDDNHVFVRSNAAEALGKLQVKEPFVIKSLVKSLLDEKLLVRDSAVNALGELQVKEPFVIEALSKLVYAKPPFQSTVLPTLAKLSRSNHASFMQALALIISNLKETLKEKNGDNFTILNIISNNFTPEGFLQEKLNNSINSPHQGNVFYSQTKKESYFPIESQMRKDKFESVEKIDNTTETRLLSTKDSEDILLIQDPIGSIILSSELPINAKHISNSDLQFEQYSVSDGESFGFSVFGINREEGYQLLVNNIVGVTPILKKGVTDALLTESFIYYLQENNFASQEFIKAFNYYQQQAQQSLNIDEEYEELIHHASQLDVVLNYINYDVRDKKIDAGWSHPAILQALAHIQEINLYIWERGDNHQLNPLAVNPHYAPQGDTQRIDLLFTNGNHFDRLVIKDIKNNKEKTRLSEFSQTGLSLFSSTSLANLNTTNETSFDVSQTFQQKP